MSIWVVVAGYGLAILAVSLILVSPRVRDGLAQLPRTLYRHLRTASTRTLLAIPTPTHRSQREGYHPVWTVLAMVTLTSVPALYFLTHKPNEEMELQRSTEFADDPQIRALLEGEMLVPPPDIPEEVIASVAADIASEPADALSIPADSISVPADNLPPEERTKRIEQVRQTRQLIGSMLRTADRKWDKMNPRYVQRLLLVFKIMKEQYGYDVVLLEGYRSPERQNRLAALGASVTHATGYRSYHQFGLAADCAFMRDGRIVISERDPWAMRGYQLYGQTAESVGLTWGGRWKMMDLGHTEFKMAGILGRADIAARLTSESSSGVGESYSYSSGSTLN